MAFRVTNLTADGYRAIGGTFDVRSVTIGITGIKTGAVLLGVPNFRAVNLTKVSMANRPLNPGALFGSRESPPTRRCKFAPEPAERRRTWLQRGVRRFLI